MSKSTEMLAARGKKIRAIKLRPFNGELEGSSKIVTYDPLIEFTDGSTMYFTVDETEVGVYGVVPHLTASVS